MDDQFNPQPRPQTAKRTKINNDASISDASFSVSQTVCTGDLPGLSSASAVTESSLDVNFDSGDTSLLVPQQRGMDASSVSLQVSTKTSMSRVNFLLLNLFSKAILMKRFRTPALMT